MGGRALMVRTVVRALFWGVVVVLVTVVLPLSIYCWAHPVIPIESIQLPTLEMP